MKRLFLLRHAQAQSNVYNAPLTSYGMLEAKKMGEFIKNNELIPELVLCSPAERTCTTYSRVFEIVTKKPRLVIKDKLYNALANEIIKILLRYLIKLVI